MIQGQHTDLVQGSLLGPQYLMGYLLTLVWEHWQVTCIIVGLIGLTRKNYEIINFKLISI